MLRRVYFLTFFAILSCQRVYADNKEAYIETPTPCHKLERVEGANVYLTSSNEACIQVISKMPVKLDSSVKIVNIYSNNKFWKEQILTEFNIDSIGGYMSNAKKYEENLIIPESKHKSEAQKSAEETVEYFNSEEFQRKLQTESDRLKEGMFKKTLNDYYPDIDIKQPSGGQKLLPTERIYLFISSSMPIETIRGYIASIDRIGGPNISIVIRGFIDGMKYIKPTMEFTNKIIVRDSGCDGLKQLCDTYNANFIIDPLLFRKYEINMVPAVVYVKGVNIVDTERSEGAGDNVNGGDYYKVYGDASLDYMLKIIKKEADSTPPKEAAANSTSKK